MSKNEEKILVTRTSTIHEFMKQGGTDDSYTGVITDKEKIKGLYTRIDNEYDGIQVKRRGDMEEDTNYKQFIPYTIIKDSSDGKYLVYRRLSKGDEKRLSGKYSLGVGGHSNLHLNKQDIERIIKYIGVGGVTTAHEFHLVSTAIINMLGELEGSYENLVAKGIISTTLHEMLVENMQRELYEELEILGTIDTEIIGVLNDESNETSAVHVGILQEGIVTSKENVSVTKEEEELLEIVGWYSVEELQEQLRQGTEFESWSEIVINLLKGRE